MATERREAGFGESVLGAGVMSRIDRAFARYALDWRVVAAAVAMGALVLIPYLGAVGLWDPWETHYGEVGRSMIQRSDYVFPYWESDWFFSKPPLTLWLQALGMQLAGTNRTGGAVGLYTEWGMRTPFVLLALASLGMLTLAVKRAASTRAALATAFVLVTMPMYFLINRQTVTDTPFVACMTAAMSSAIIALIGKGTRNRTAWWLSFYVFTGLSVLAKGLLAGIPPAVLLAFAGLCVMPWDRASLDAHARWLSDRTLRAQVRDGKQPMPTLWDHLFQMKLLTGLGVFLLVAAPWFLAMTTLNDLDDENRTFWQRFIYDHFSRIGAGVHTTTPGGVFTYFIEQGGYAIFPWVAVLPGAFTMLSRIRLRSTDARDQLALIGFLWALIAFALVAFSATKFHHYIFPTLPGLAILFGLYIDRLWEEGVADHAVPLILGGVLFALVGKDLASNPKNFTDLFVYNYDRPYPVDLVNRPISLFGFRTLWTGDLLTLLLLAFGAYLTTEAFRDRKATVWSRAVALVLALCGLALLVTLSTRGRQSPTLFLGLALALVALYVGATAAKAAAAERMNLFSGAAALGIAAVALIVSGARLPAGGDPLLLQLTEKVNLKVAMGMAFAVAGGLALIAALQRSRTLLFGTFWALALGFTLWFNWSHWVDLSHHWTQRDLFWRYYEQRRPGEPIAAYLMNWRGETFYSRNTVKQIPATNNTARLQAFAALPGREFVLVEHNRLNLVRNALPDKKVTPIDRDLNNKFVLVTVD